MSNITVTHLNIINYTGNLFIQGLFYALVTGIALSQLTGKRNGFNFINLFNKINNKSPNAGIVLYLFVILPIIPIIGFLQSLFISIPIMIILLERHGADKQKTQIHKKGKPQVAI